LTGTSVTFIHVQADSIFKYDSVTVFEYRIN